MASVYKSQKADKNISIEREICFKGSVEDIKVIKIDSSLQKKKKKD